MAQYQLHLIERAPLAPTTLPPLLFIHGQGHGAWVWDEHFLSYFAQNGFHAFALDLRGHGASEGRADLMRFRMTDYIDDVTQTATDLVKRGFAPPALIGHSLGGGIVESILDQRLLNMPAAALLAPIPRAAGWKMATSAAIKAFGFTRMARVLFTHDTSLMYETPEVARRAFFAPDMPDEQARAYWERLQPESWMNGDTGRFAVTQPLPDLDTPLLFVSGSEDKAFPPAAVKLTADYYRARFVEVEGVAHELMLDPHWERPASAVLDWLRETLPSATPAPG